MPRSTSARATRATYVAFAADGFAFASWASRIPQVKVRLGLDASQLGLLLLAVAAGSVLALPVSGAVVGRFGSRRTVAAAALVAGVALMIVAVGYRAGVTPVAAGLFALGIATGTWDVAMNVQGAAVERRLGRAIMARFHAGFSLGTVTGAVIGAAMVALHVSVTVHMLLIGVILVAAVPVAAQSFIADHAGGAGDAGGGGADDDPEAAGARPGSALRAWREPRTLLVGLFVLAFAFAEGSGNDWIGVAMVDGHGAAPVVGTLAFATFLMAMTVVRWCGPWLLDGYGRVPVMRALTVVAIAGLVLFAWGPSTPVAFAGAVLWGAGASLGFPVGMSAGADEPALAAPRVGVISSIGYCAFLGGPPLLGFLGERYTVPHALLAVVVLLVISGALGGVVAPPRPADG